MKLSLTTAVAITLALTIHGLAFIYFSCQPTITYVGHQPNAYLVTKMSINHRANKPSSPLSNQQANEKNSNKKADITPSKKVAARPVIKKQPTKANIEETHKQNPTAITKKTVKTAPVKSQITAVPKASNHKPSSPIQASGSSPSTVKPANNASANVDNAKSAAIMLTEHQTNEYINFVRTQILQHKRYPKQAKMRRHEGNITAVFTLTANGGIKDIVLLHKSSSKYLNKSVKKLLRRINLPSPTPQIKHAFPKRLTLTFEFSLQQLNS